MVISSFFSHDHLGQQRAILYRRERSGATEGNLLLSRFLKEGLSMSMLPLGKTRREV